jgi:hypothetical protein
MSTRTERRVAVLQRVDGATSIYAPARTSAIRIERASSRAAEAAFSFLLRRNRGGGVRARERLRAREDLVRVCNGRSGELDFEAIAHGAHMNLHRCPGKRERICHPRLGRSRHCR